VNRISVAFAFASITLCGAATAADAPSLFGDTGPIAISLEAPLSRIAQDDAEDPAYLSGVVVWKDATGTEVRVPIKVKARGKSRRKDAACQFPPLRLNFPKDIAPGTPFSGLDKVKLVTHCGRLGEKRAAYATRVELELLLYRVFGRISPSSLRVQPLDITYVDTDRDGKRNAHAAFLIEPEEWLAKRRGARLADVASIEREQLEPVQANLVEVFQFLAGNTDFSLIRGPKGETCCHNIVLLAASDGAILPVPYDFDATGIVAAPYAKPVEALGIERVQQRLYRGYCRPEAVLAATLEKFRAARSDIYALFTGDPRLDAATIGRTTAYLDEFYEIIDQPDSLKRKVSSRCI
jgi:hypothetical protein